MATKELRELRHRYKAAYTIYLTCVQTLSDASQEGTWPAEAILQAEERALNELTLTRRALLAALQKYGGKTESSSSRDG